MTLEAQMRLERGWAVVWVHNLSRQGMMLWSNRPPRPGAYIELRRATTTIIARAVWVRDKFFGIRTEAPLDIHGLMSGAASAPVRLPRAASKALSIAVAEHNAQRPRRTAITASSIDFGLVAICVSIGAGAAVMLEYRALAAISHLISAALLGAP